MAAAESSRYNHLVFWRYRVTEVRAEAEPKNEAKIIKVQHLENSLLDGHPVVVYDIEYVPGAGGKG